ncbi:MAG TPA: ABC transporter ATP-binding protein [Actinomycetota bacterium]|nr:ABC transporter ATP-binding protein [Actinomycetota bacterium]
MSAVEVRDLVKEFPKRGGGLVRAVDGISFSVEEGEIFGFLGPNGAGKTTSLEIMEGLQTPTSGSATVLGFNSTTQSEEMKRRIGIQLQAGAYFDYLTLREILELFGSFYPRQLKPDDLLARVQLTDKADSLVKQLSGGQQQRFSIVASIVNDPDVVFLDEATTGLDPRARRDVWDLIRDIRESGKTIVLTTHYMEEAESLCDRIAIIDQGRIVALDTPRGLVQTLSSAYRIVFETRDGSDLSSVAKLPGVVAAGPARGRPDSHQLEVHDPAETLPSLFTWAKEQRIELSDLQVLPATLEDVFLSRTGHALVADEEAEVGA